jgi:hypothetical protein
MDPVGSMVAVVPRVLSIASERPDPDGTGRRTLGNERYGSQWRRGQVEYSSIWIMIAIMMRVVAEWACVCGVVWRRDLLYYGSVQYRQSSNGFHFHIAGRYELISHGHGHGHAPFLCIQMKLD